MIRAQPAYGADGVPQKFGFVANGEGRYTAYAITPSGRVRVGEVLGRAGHWMGDSSNTSVGPCRTRTDVAHRLACRPPAGHLTPKGSGLG